MKKSIISAAIILAAAACTTNTAKVEYGKEMSLKQIFENGTAVELPADFQPNIVFDSAKVAGFSGVNRYFGGMEYDEKSGKCEFGQMATTMMAGPNLDLESKFLKRLSDVKYLQVEKDSSVVLLDAGKNKVAVFK